MLELLGGPMVCFYMLSVQITIVPGTVWPHFAMQILTGGGDRSSLWWRGGRRGLEMEAYLSLFSPWSNLSQTDGDGWTYRIGLAKGGNTH